MRYDTMDGSSLSYFPCRYGNSKIFFRGPRKSLDGQYVAFVGGTETYGKFVETPFPDLLEEMTGRTCVNLGCVNASIEAFLNEPAVWAAVHDATLTVVQVMGAHNISNRFYSVHPRRNDRLVRASTVLQALYPEVDFTEFCFTRHMLQTLWQVGPDRFPILRSELQTAWSARMERFLAEIGPRSLLLWIGDHLPTDIPWELRDAPLDSEPMFVTRAMIDSLRPRVRGVVMAQVSAKARATGTDGMIFGPGQSTAAEGLPNPATHKEIAESLKGAFALSFGSTTARG
jgi:hypothetical protein